MDKILNKICIHKNNNKNDNKHKVKKLASNAMMRLAVAIIAFSFVIGITAVANPTIFALTVADSFALASGAGNHTQGTTVQIHAGHRHGFVFAGWQPASAVANAANPNTTLVMPQAALTVTATWLPITHAVGMRWVAVMDSWLPPAQSGEGARMPGQWVTINAGTRPGYFFWGWATSPNIELANPHSSVANFLMPHSPVGVQALWAPQGWAGGADQGFVWVPGQGWWHPQFGWIGPELPPGWGTTMPPNWDWNWGWPQQPNWPWQWQQGPNWHHRWTGGVVIAYSGGIGNFPRYSITTIGSSTSFQVQVDRIASAEGSTLVGQWLRDGVNHGNAFPIVTNADGIAVVNLNIPNVEAGHAGSYVLRVATMTGTTTTHVDTSRPLRLYVQSPVETFTHDTPDYRIPRAPRPSLPN